jgi:sugar O-acyltransferase (sialic acid O-acetyltransferase NeuD family)
MKRLALLGASGHGKVVADVALACGWDEVSFFDDAWPERSKNGPWPVVGNGAMLMACLHEFQGVIVSIGDCAVRWSKHLELRAAGGTLVTVVHPTATISRYAALGAGSVVMAAAVVNIDSHIGQAAIINTGATVDHDCWLADGVHICPGAHLSGSVRVGYCSMVGVGVAVKQGITIGNQTIIGAGAVLVRHVEDGAVVAGNPAHKLH